MSFFKIPALLFYLSEVVRAAGPSGADNPQLHSSPDARMCSSELDGRGQDAAAEIHPEIMKLLDLTQYGREALPATIDLSQISPEAIEGLQVMSKLLDAFVAVRDPNSSVLRDYVARVNQRLMFENKIRQLGELYGIQLPRPDPRQSSIEATLPMVRNFTLYAPVSIDYGWNDRLRVAPMPTLIRELSATQTPTSFVDPAYGDPSRVLVKIGFNGQTLHLTRENGLLSRESPLYREALLRLEFVYQTFEDRATSDEVTGFRALDQMLDPERVAFFMFSQPGTDAIDIIMRVVDGSEYPIGAPEVAMSATPILHAVPVPIEIRYRHLELPERAARRRVIELGRVAGNIETITGGLHPIASRVADYLLMNLDVEYDFDGSIYVETNAAGARLYQQKKYGSFELVYGPEELRIPKATEHKSYVLRISIAKFIETFGVGDPKVYGTYPKARNPRVKR